MAATPQSTPSRLGRTVLSEKTRRKIGKIFRQFFVLPGMTVFFVFLLIPMIQSVRITAFTTGMVSAL